MNEPRLPVRAVLVDLDDTLYPQAEMSEVAWRALAERGERLGLDHDALLGALQDEAAAGPARDGVIARALERVGGSSDHVDVLLDAFRAVEPDRLTPYPGAVEALALVRSRVPVALVTDGEVTGQQRKVAALGLTDAFDVIVYSDHGGRAHRKPHAWPFRTALGRLGVPPERAVMIGDRPDEDIAGAVDVGMRAIRVGTGGYAAHPDHLATWLRADTFVDAVRLLFPHLEPAAVSGGPRPSRRGRLPRPSPG